MPLASTRIEAPPIALLGVEPLRAAIEYAAMHLMERRSLPRGDGHAVVIFPGLGAGTRAIAPLRRHCEKLGYETYDWGRGINRGPGDDLDAWIAGLADELARRVERHEAPVSLLGWSLGGIYAREVAKRMPRRVRQVITIGSPFAGTPDATHAALLYRLLKGRRASVDARVAHALRVAPPVPTTSIFSRTDGVVAWQACYATHGPCIENIEVESSHLGLVWHPRVLAIVADRLGQPAGRWRPMQAAPHGDKAAPRRPQRVRRRRERAFGLS
jgi:pimeloyl-ACP methyl ester carboxylesterase